VLGTTDVPVKSPLDLEIEPWEIDLLLAEGEFMIPGLESARALRAWSGIRPLYDPGVRSTGTRDLPRAHAILDHKEQDDVEGIISVIGGKLTTFRLMAEETVDLVCDKLEQDLKCSTSTTTLLPHTSSRKTFSLPDRLERFARDRKSAQGARLTCECEIIYQDQLETAIRASELESLDDLRRDLRLGMGPCQAAFCAYRTAGLAARISARPVSAGFLETFLDERWKGMRPLAWGTGLRQMDLARRLYLELLGETKKEAQI
jgi:glycerol-3-phosphate dehydrogenase